MEGLPLLLIAGVAAAIAVWALHHAERVGRKDEDVDESQRGTH